MKTAIKCATLKYVESKLPNAIGISQLRLLASLIARDIAPQLAHEDEEMVDSND